MKVSNYMSRKLVTVAPDAPAKEALRLMLEHRFRHLPVIEGGKLVGIVSDRDLRRPQWADPLADWTQYYRIDDDTRVSEVMTRNPETVRTFDSILKASRILREGKYGALPVLDKPGELVGMLSAVDLLGAFEKLMEGVKD